MARQKFKPGLIPTLGDLREHTCWLWVHCEGKKPDGLQCYHHAPVALAAPLIVYGYNASSNVLRQKALLHPVWESRREP